MLSVSNLIGDGNGFSLISDRWPGALLTDSRVCVLLAGSAIHRHIAMAYTLTFCDRQRLFDAPRFPVRFVLCVGPVILPIAILTGDVSTARTP